jgi:hypothetical protein
MLEEREKEYERLLKDEEEKFKLDNRNHSRQLKSEQEERLASLEADLQKEVEKAEKRVRPTRNPNHSHHPPHR